MEKSPNLLFSAVFQFLSNKKITSNGMLQMCSAKEIVQILLERIIDKLIVSKGNNVCVVINNLGTLTQLELLVVANEVKLQLSKLI